MKLKILTPGLLATVQDMGRPYWRSSGVPHGGAADNVSHRIANFLVGNESNAASLEVAGGGLIALVEEGGWLALAGEGGRMFADKTEVPGEHRVFIPESVLLEIRPNARGNFCYLATPGGWDVPEVLESRSTCLTASFGGFEGRGLQKGDTLRASCSSDNQESHSEKFRVSKWFVRDPTFRKLTTFGKFDATTIRVMPGPEIHWWSAAQQAQFFDTPFAVSKQRDRMGARLEIEPPFGKSVTFRKSDTMLSTAVCPGAVQMPPNGKPIVLLADAQTTGGYPRIAQVIAVDIPVFAQIQAGQIIHFHKVTLEEAERLYFEQEKLLRKIQLALKLVTG